MSRRLPRPKFGLEAVGDVFRQELRPWGIGVSLVEPGSIATPIWERGVSEADAVVERASPSGEGPLSRSTSPRYREGGAAQRPPRDPAREGRGHDRAGADLCAGPGPATWSGSTPGQALLARLLPDRVIDRLIVALSGALERRSAGGGAGRLALPSIEITADHRTRVERDHGRGLVERRRRPRPAVAARAFASARRVSGSDHRACYVAGLLDRRLGDRQGLLGPADRRSAPRRACLPRQASISPPSPSPRGRSARPPRSTPAPTS